MTNEIIPSNSVIKYMSIADCKAILRVINRYYPKIEIDPIDPQLSLFNTKHNTIIDVVEKTTNYNTNYIDHNECIYRLYEYISIQNLSRESVDRIMKKMDDEEVVLSGFFLSTLLPSESRLKQTRVNSYKMNRQINKTKKLNAEEKFFLYSPKLKNRFVTIRKRLYKTAIPKVCRPIQNLGGKNTIWLMPQNHLIDWFREVAIINGMLHDLKQEIMTEYRRMISHGNEVTLSDEYGSDVVNIKKPNIHGMEIQYDLDPIQLASNVLTSMLTETLNQELEIEIRNMIHDYNETATERKKALVQKLEREIMNDFMQHLKDLSDQIYATMNSDGSKNIHTNTITKIRKISEEADSYGYKHLANVMRSTADCANYLRRYNSKKKGDSNSPELKGELFKVAKQLSQTMNLPMPKKGEDANNTILQTTMKLRGVTNARTMLLKQRWNGDKHE